MVPPSPPPPRSALEAARTEVPFGAALRWWWALGWLSFGGPAGQIALLHRELVERRRWISERRFLHALDYCLLLPGPEAQQLATYMGWLLHGIPGGVAAGVLFVLPGLLVMVGLSWAYVSFGALPAVAGVLWALKPAVLAIVLGAVLRLSGAVRADRFGIGLAVAAFLGLAVLDAPFPVVVLGAMVAGFVRGAPPAALTGEDPDDEPPPPWARPSRARLGRVLLAGVGIGAAVYAALVATFGATATPTLMAGFFTRVALLSVGGAYAALPYVWQGAVEGHGWLDPRQVVDGLALGETTPGPLVLVFVFVGFVGSWQHPPPGVDPLTAALIGAGVTALFTFLPSFLFILGGGPWVEAGRMSRRLRPALAGVRAATVGVIAHLGLLFGALTVWPEGRLDLGAAALTVVATVATVRFGVGVGWLVGGAVAVGLVVTLV